MGLATKRAKSVPPGGAAGGRGGAVLPPINVFLKGNV
jgi:hypothetical protein